MASLSCPNCGGAASGGRGCLTLCVMIFTFPFSLPFFLLKPTYSCRSCGFRFKA